MSSQENHDHDEKLLSKLARLFVEIPDSTDVTAIEAELQEHDVDIARLATRIQSMVETAAEKERLAWLEDYRTTHARQSLRLPSPKKELPKGRAERLRLLEQLQKQSAARGLPLAVGFKKLKLDELSDDDLARIIAVLQEETEDRQDAS